MPASLPGATKTENEGNPTQGIGVIMDPLSGPKASPLDARKITGWSGGMPVYANDPLNLSTGQLSTGIGYGVISPIPQAVVGIQFKDAGFTDDYVPGQDKPDSTQAADSTYMYIGGGRSLANGTPNPYTVAGVGLAFAGGGQQRDAGTGVGAPMKSVTAAATVATGAVVETGFVNRQGYSITTGQTIFGAGSAALPAPTLARSDEEVLLEQQGQQRMIEEAKERDRLEMVGEREGDRRNPKDPSKIESDETVPEPSRQGQPDPEEMEKAPEDDGEEVKRNPRRR